MTGLCRLRKSNGYIYRLMNNKRNRNVDNPDRRKGVMPESNEKKLKD